MKKLFSIAKKVTKMLYSKNKSLVIIDLLQSIFSALIPLASIYISSKIVDSIISADSIKAREIIIIGLFAMLIIMLASNLSISILDYFSDLLFRRTDKNYMDSFNKKDYAKIDNHRHIESFAQIRSMEKYMGTTVEVIFAYLLNFINSFVTVIISFIMFIGAFNKYLPQTSRYKFIDSPIIIFLFFLILILSSVIASKAENVSMNFFYKNGQKATFHNNLWRFYAYGISEEKRALDVRLFKQNIKVAKQFNRSDHPFRVGGIIDKYFKTEAMFINSISVLADRGKFFLILAFVIIKAYEGALSPGEFTRYLGAILQFTNAVALSIRYYMRFVERANTSAELITFLEDGESIYKGSLTTEKRSDRKYEIEFKNISFKYNEDQEWILRDVNLRFDLGKRLAIVGENGSGKTTFIKLLIRLYDPQEGQILLNGIDIKKYRYEDYLKIFSVVFQDFKLFAYPLGENIAGSKTYDKARVMETIKDVGLSDRLKTMKNGLDTYLYRDIDEEGIMISGGEAQKIAIARALYQDSPYIILDEPTAALDPVAEQEIYQKLSDIIKDRTAIFISHRLSSCKFADEIVVFDQGTIIEKGSHEDLLDQDSKYKELWDAQAQYYV